MANRYYKWCFIGCLFVICLLALKPATMAAKVSAGDNVQMRHQFFFAKTIGDKLKKDDANHPFYITVTEINHNAKDKILEISCKMFLDDLEKTLTTITKSAVDLTNIKDKAKTDKLVADYITAHLQLKVDGKPVTLQYIGFEKEGDAAWCYLQVNNVPAVKQVEVKNMLLFEEFDSQISIMHVIVGGVRKSTRLNKPDSVAKFEF